MSMYRLLSRVAVFAAAAFTCPIFVATAAAQLTFVSTVVGTRPVAYYRLDATQGKSQVGLTTYKSEGGVSVAQPGAPVGERNSQSIQLDGHDGWVVSTQAGGVGTAASMMAWINLAGLPSDARHFFYIEGESQNGNDLDLQIEDDNQLKFYTAAGGHLTYVPAPGSLINQWHMVVVTLDTATHTRVIYWDGKQVATDHGGGEAGKTGLFSVGASTVFGGRYFHGGIAETALWNRALRESEVTSIFAAAKPTPGVAGPGAGSGMAGMAGVVGMTGMATGSGPFATTAKIEVDDNKGQVPLKRPEQIAIMFLSAIQQIELNCQLNEKHACPMDVVWGRLKYDPKTDPNYAYTLGANDMAWEAHANAKKPGLMGFCFLSNGLANVKATYNRGGMAGPIDNELSGRSIEGDSFSKQ